MDVDDIVEAKYEIRALLTKKGYNFSTFVKAYNAAMGKSTTVQNFTQRLNSGNLKYVEVKKIAEFLGYKLKWEE